MHRRRKLRRASKQPPGPLASWLRDHDARRMQDAGPTCLDETTVTLFVDGRLTGDRVAAVELHVDACASCRRLLAALVRG